MTALPLTRRLATLLLAGSALGLLGGCAAFHTFTSDVSSFGDWPAERRPGSFAFDRLPSQQAQATEQESLEQLALPALQAAGFTPAPEGVAADVLVQVGARSERQLRSPWDDPLWMRPWGPWGPSPRPGFWLSARWPDAGWMRSDYSREVALLIRDRSSGKALYEVHASSSGTTQGSNALYGALFATALKEFPAIHVEPHPVSVEMP
jgi:hypothetical protein